MWLVKCATVLIVLLVPTAGFAAEEMFNFGCGPYRYVDLAKLDYRLKDATPENAKGAWNLDHYHTIPASEEMRSPTPYAANVMGNLDFTLRHSPNHHEALHLLIDYARS